jgi:hypothetical protein
LVAVAITRAGEGTAYLFESWFDARVHPLTQYGDSILEDKYDLFGDFFVSEFPRFLRNIGRPDIEVRFKDRLAALKSQGKVDRIIGREIRDELGDECFQALVSVAVPPPTDPTIICQLVRSDREADARERRDKMAAKEAAKAADPKEAKAPKEPKPAKVVGPKTIGGHQMSAVITFGQDAKGVDYGPKNNPKREGSKSFDRFACYKAGMTIEKALAAGVLAADITYDAGHQFIVITD